MCTVLSQQCMCKVEAMLTPQYASAGAPCSGSLVCTTSRADSTAGFCLPVFWGSTVNKAGAGSSYGGVTGPWVGGTQGPNGAGGPLPSFSYSGGSSASPPSPPPPPPPSKNATLRPVRHHHSLNSAHSVTCDQKFKLHFFSSDMITAWLEALQTLC